MASFNSYVRSALDAYMAAQERRAQRHVDAALMGMDDATLARLGYSREELRKRRSAYLR